MAFYIPPPYKSNLITEGLLYMAQHPNVPTIWMGDFNMVLNPQKDRTQLSQSAHSPDTTRFGRTLKEFSLTDTWRYHHLNAQAYSCISTTHSTMSRIDLILVSDTLLPRLLGSGYHTRSLSDHAPCWATLQLTPFTGPHTWRLHPFWLSMLTDQEGIHKEWQFYFNVNRDTAPVGQVWEAYKLHVRTILSSRIHRIKASYNLILNQASDKADLLTKEFQNDPTQDRAAAIRLHTRLLDQLHYEKAKQKLFFLKQRVF